MRICAEQTYGQHVSVKGRKPAPMLADFARKSLLTMCISARESETN
jgi:hypothetical protein